MKKQLIPLLFSLAIPLAAGISLAQGPEGKELVLKRGELKAKLLEMLAKHDEAGLASIENTYAHADPDWRIDAEPLFIYRYEQARPALGTAREDEYGFRIGLICGVVRQRGYPSLLRRMKEDFGNTNPYVFPESVLLSGWGNVNDKHQWKGVRGQFLATFVALGGEEETDDVIARIKELKPDADERLLGIWALGYSDSDTAVEFLEGLALSEVLRERLLARSALTYMVQGLESRKENAGQIPEVKRDRLERLNAFRERYSFRNKGVSAGEYYPF